MIRWILLFIDSAMALVALRTTDVSADGGSVLLDRCGPLGDLDGDGQVGISDFLILLSAWGPCPGFCPPSCTADLDGDCDVGINDSLMLLANWG